MQHLIKLSVGSKTVDDLLRWQASPPCPRVLGRPAHITRMFPKKRDEILSGGSLYWVIAGQISARQQVHDLQEVVGDDGIRRCAIILEPALIRTTPALRRPFQGWRYLDPKDAPRDLGPAGGTDTLPPDLEAALAEIGVI